MGKHNPNVEEIRGLLSGILNDPSLADAFDLSKEFSGISLSSLPKSPPKTNRGSPRKTRDENKTPSNSEAFTASVAPDLGCKNVSPIKAATPPPHKGPSPIKLPPPTPARKLSPAKVAPPSSLTALLPIRLAKPPIRLPSPPIKPSPPAAEPRLSPVKAAPPSPPSPKALPLTKLPLAEQPSGNLLHHVELTPVERLLPPTQTATDSAVPQAATPPPQPKGLQPTKATVLATTPDPPCDANTVYVVEDGDMLLVWGEEKKARYSVSSATLSQASVPLQKMIESSRLLKSISSEVVTNQPLTVELPEELPDAARTVLLVLHGKLDDISPMTRDILFRVCILSYEYDITAALKPLWKSWSEKMLQQSSVVGTRMIRQLWVAYVLGQESEFLRLWSQLVWHSSVDEKGNLLIEGAKLASGAPAGKGKYATAMAKVLQSLSKGRVDVTQKITGMASNAEQLLRRTIPLPKEWNRSTVCRVSSKSKGQEMCDCAMLGALYRAADFDRWSFSDMPVLESPKDCYSRLIRVRDRACQIVNVHSPPHGSCDPWAGILFSAEHFQHSVVVCQSSTEQKAHFKQQAAKSGMK